jgi:glutamine amidotransferase
MIVVIDYGMGNIGSVLNMLKKIGAEAAISPRPEDILAADKLILPGVGAFDTGMIRLEERGLVSVLRKKVIEERAPLLGICLGMQLLSKSSEEGRLPGLGFLEARTVKFRFGEGPPGEKFRIPQMGWNRVEVRGADPLFRDMYPEPRFYFVHSYHVVCAEERDIIAVTRYGYEFASAVRRDNIAGVQFHPEKSHKFGMRLLKNFAEIRPLA